MSAVAGRGPQPLSTQDAAKCREAFCDLDGGSGDLPLRRLRAALQRLAVYPTEEDLFGLIAKHDPEGKGSLGLSAFLALIAEYRSLAASAPPADTGTLDAFVALGGNRDQSGVVSTERLRSIVRNDFALPIDIDRLIREADTDGSGFIDYEEFAAMLSSANI
jgi:Ca2+-binding EF-hand superfamily protein